MFSKWSIYIIPRVGLAALFSILFVGSSCIGENRHPSHSEMPLDIGGNVEKSRSENYVPFEPKMGCKYWRSCRYKNWNPAIISSHPTISVHFHNIHANLPFTEHIMLTNGNEAVISHDVCFAFDLEIRFFVEPTELFYTTDDIYEILYIRMWELYEISEPSSLPKPTIFTLPPQVDRVPLGQVQEVIPGWPTYLVDVEYGKNAIAILFRYHGGIVSWKQGNEWW